MRRSIALLLVLLLTLGIVAYAEDMSEVKTPEVLKMDARGQEVQSLQSKLNELGFYCGKADGIFGPRTEAALKELQGAINWDVTGEVPVADLQTLLSLTDADVLSGNVEKPLDMEETMETDASEEAEQDGLGAVSVDDEDNDVEYTTENDEIAEADTPVDEILSAVQDYTNDEDENLIIDQCFGNIEKNWVYWREPEVCETVEMDGTSWLHLISKGGQNDGITQSAMTRDHAGTTELVKGISYSVSVKALASNESIGKVFTFGVYNNPTDETIEAEQFWSSQNILSEKVQEYSFTFTASVDGSLTIYLGQGINDRVEAWYTDITVEVAK